MRIRLTSNGKSLFIKKLHSAWKCQAEGTLSASFYARPLVLFLFEPAVLLCLVLTVAY